MRTLDTMAGPAMYILTYIAYTRSMVRQPISVYFPKFSILSKLIGTFVRYGPNRLLINSERGLKGKEYTHPVFFVFILFYASLQDDSTDL